MGPTTGHEVPHQRQQILRSPDALPVSTTETSAEQKGQGRGREGDRLRVALVLETTHSDLSDDNCYDLEIARLPVPPGSRGR